MAKLWFAQCALHHGKGCSEQGSSLALGKPAFLRLVDVENLRIVVPEDPASSRYVALSYVWGGAQMVKLRSTNVEQLALPRGLEPFLPSLPRTIVDALRVARAVGERYLW